jgi:Beta-lactamase enzyme family/ORF 12 gene product N-terminal
MTSRRSQAFRGLFRGARAPLSFVSLASGTSLAACVSLAACGEPAKPAAAPAFPTPAAADAAASDLPLDAGAPVASLPPGVPDSPAGHQLAWVLASLAQPPSEADVAPHLTASFIAEAPPAKMVALFGQIGALLSPLVIDRVEPGPTPEALVAVAHSEKAGGAGPKLKISLLVEPALPHKISGLIFGPAIEAKASWDEVKSGLGTVAPEVNFLAAEIAGGKCVPLASLEPKKPLALGSAFKLYILEALAKQVAAGKHKWDDTIAIEDAKKSLPSGEMRNEPAGKTFSVRAFAEKMISVSDNTATDHLLAFVGRGAVEDAVKASGNGAAARNVPFLSTRDTFALKLLGSPDELHAYAAADVPHRRKLLDTFEKRDLATAPVGDGWNKPRMIDSIEWFASPEDLCKLMVELKARADAPATAPIGTILSTNPGIPDEAGAYKYIGFKGGSEPGVLNLTWLLQRKSDDKWVFLTVGFNDPNNVIDEPKAITATIAARDFLAK